MNQTTKILLLSTLFNSIGLIVLSVALFVVNSRV